MRDLILDLGHDHPDVHGRAHQDVARDHDPDRNGMEVQDEVEDATRVADHLGPDRVVVHLEDVLDGHQCRIERGMLVIE